MMFETFISIAHFRILDWLLSVRDMCTWLIFEFLDF